MKKNITQKILLLEEFGIATVQDNLKIKQVITNKNTYEIEDVHIGKIKTILNNINAAFIEIDSFGKNGFIQLEDINKNYHFKANSGIIVQIIKEPSGDKGPSLSSDIKLPGKYLSLYFNKNRRNLKKKIVEDYDKQYFKVLQTLFSPQNTEILIEEEALKINILHLVKDLKKVHKQWKIIEEELQKSNKPRRINKKIDFFYKILRDFYNDKVKKIVVGSKAEAIKINNILMQWQNANKQNLLKIEYFLDKKHLRQNYNLESICHQVIQSRIVLRSGASIIIEKTEALTVIDVNSGTFRNVNKLKKSTLWVNCEAAMEIAHQLVLRNIGGVIVVDFIDMNSQKDQFHLLNYFNKFLCNDKNNPKIIQFSEIGLVELTRTRKGKNIYDIFTIKCYKCDSNGYILKKFNFNMKKKYKVLSLETSSIE